MTVGPFDFNHICATHLRRWTRFIDFLYYASNFKSFFFGGVGDFSIPEKNYVVRYSYLFIFIVERKTLSRDLFIPGWTDTANERKATWVDGGPVTYTSW